MINDDPIYLSIHLQFDLVNESYLYTMSVTV